MSQTPVEKFSAERFSQHLNENFQIQLGEETVATELIEVQGEQERFSVLFAGPCDKPLTQSVYTLGNEGFGEFQIFLVPLGPDAAGAKLIYEAVFS